MNVTIYKPEDCLDEMLNSLRNGKVKGTTTYSDEVDKCWTWRKKEANIWTGYSNEGKSFFLKQLFMAKALNEGWKGIFCSPEDFPPDEFFDDAIHTLTGKSTDRDRVDNLISEKEYREAFEYIKDKFIFLYIEPPNNTVQGVLKEMEKIIEKEDIDVAVIDPLIKFSRPKDMSDRDDIYASFIGSICTDFCRKSDLSFHLVMHQLTPVMDAMTKFYLEPNMYRIKGGGTWSDGFDNVLSVWRPKYAIDKLDPTVQFSSQKIKKQKLVGIPQKMEMSFDRKSNRYLDKQNNESIFDFDKFIKKPIKKFIQ
jgi:twinkle protein